MSDAPKAIWSGETLAMDHSAAHRIAVIHYQVRAVAHRIAAECERILEDVDRPERSLWRAAVAAGSHSNRR